MAEEGDNAQIQDRIKSLEEQLQDVQKRTRDLMAPQTETTEPVVEARQSQEFKDNSSFPVPKEQEFPPVKERSGKATGRYDQDVGDLAQSKELRSSSSSRSSSPPPRAPADPPQPPFYQPGMPPPQMPSFYPMYQPQYFPMPQMNYMPQMQPMPMPMMNPMMPQYQSFDGQQYWGQRPPQEQRGRGQPENVRQSHNSDDIRAELEKQRQHYEDLLKERDEELDKLRQGLSDRPPDQSSDPSLVRKLQSTEEELAFARKEMELAREYIEKFKGQLDEKDRGMRYKIQELDSENKALREKLEKMEATVASERMKTAAAMERVGQTEDAMTGMQERLTMTSKDLDEMKRTRLQYIQKYQGDVEALRKEVKSLNNALEQANLQLDHARYDFQQSERRARHTSQEQANVEINRLTQQVQVLQKQLETTGDNYARFAALQEGKGRGGFADRFERKSMSPGKREVEFEGERQQPRARAEQQYDWGSKRGQQTLEELERAAGQRKPAAEHYTHEWNDRQRPRTQPAPRREAQPRSPTQALENQLIGLQMEKQQLESEYLKLPDRSRTLVARKRRDELESRLTALDASITTLKTQLRGFKVLHK